MKRFKNNQGLSLVELIVAIAILAIIVLPLLTSFVQATKTNVKAKTRLHATEAAQNIMEGLENIELEDLVYQFNHTDSGFDLFKIGSSTTSVELDDTGSGFFEQSSFVTPAGESEAVFREKASHKYYFYLNNLEITNSDKRYNALVTVAAKPGADADHDYNNMSIADMKSIDANHDAISANADLPSSIISTIKLQYGYTNLLESDIKRTIILDIDKKDGFDAQTGDPAVITTVTARYQYYIQKYNLTFPETGSLYEDDYTSVIYDNSNHVDDDLNSVYLFYYPWYTSRHSYPLSTDNIVINNPKQINCAVNIIKQTHGDPTYLYSSEIGYKCSVFLNEIGNNGRTHASINTNLDTNISVEDTSPDYNLPGQVSYIINNSNANQNTVRSLIDINAMTKKKKTDRLFDVKVDIYPVDVNYTDLDSNTPIVTFTGGMTH